MDTRQRSRLVVTAVITVAIVLLIALWDWDWFRPMVERRASTVLGRSVRIAHLHVHLAREPTLVADDISKSTIRRRSRRVAALARSSGCRCRLHRMRCSITRSCCR
jgi:uncharacterized protein YhdP